MKRTFTVLTLALLVSLLVILSGCGGASTAPTAVASPTATSTTTTSFAATATSEVPTPTPSPTATPFVPTPTPTATPVPTAAPGYNPGKLPTWTSKTVHRDPNELVKQTLAVMFQGIQTTLRNRGQSALAKLITPLQVQAIEPDDYVMCNMDYPLGADDPAFVLDFCDLQSVQVMYVIDERIVHIADANLPLADARMLLATASYLAWVASSPRSQLPANSPIRSCIAGWTFAALINSGVTNRYYRDTVKAYMPSQDAFMRGYGMTGDYGGCLS